MGFNVIGQVKCPPSDVAKKVLQLTTSGTDLQKENSPFKTPVLSSSSRGPVRPLNGGLRGAARGPS
eukprot:2467480-Prorocentrum_lima.AAC.1